MIKNEAYLLALYSINGLGPVRLKALLSFFKDPKLIWETSAKELTEIGIPKNVIELFLETKKTLNPEKYMENLKKSGIKFMTIFDENYPKLLKEIYDPPIIFYYKGEILKQDEKAVAVVGSRKMTGYGNLVTEKIVTNLAESGITIVSGLARGVDTKAHQSTIAVSGRTMAVLGGGLNRIFPPENARLASQIAEGFGAVISEFSPDEPSLPGNFPARNRIISGLSLGVVVTEAAEDSGSLITAKCALDQGREVFAVPGPITSELSSGPLSLIKQGARLVTNGAEVMEELGLERVKSAELRGKSEIILSEIEQKILENLGFGNKHIDEICQELKLEAAVVSSSLIKMEISSLVKNLGGGNYVKIC